MARVLIVEDESTDLTILRSIVEGAGHEVYSASDGEKALQVYLQTSFDVVVTDLHMPDGDGLKFIDALGALLPRTPIIAVSGKGTHLLAEAKSRGVLVALSKPIDPHELLGFVAQAAPDGAKAVHLAGRTVGGFFLDRVKVLLAALTLFFFVLDLALPLGVASGTLYGLVVMASLWSKDAWVTYTAAIVGIGLTILGFYVSPPTVSAIGPVIINRTLSVLIILGSALIVLERKRAEKQILALNVLSTTDHLTQVRNRSVFDEVVEEEIARARRFGRELSLVLLDIDHFKTINDTQGHDQGDDVLREVAHRLVGNVRRMDVVFRLGGDEFAILLIEADLAGAEIIGKKICGAIANAPLGKNQIEATASVGIAALRQEDDQTIFYRRADEALYASKQGGRNRVTTATS